jgi:DNA polymerase elongation subunit (family B)
MPVQKVAVEQFRNETGLQRFRREESEREAAEKQRQKDAEQARIQPLLDEQNDLLRQLRTEQAQNLYSGPSEELQERCTRVPDAVPGSVDEIRAQVRDAFNGFRLQAEQEGLTLTQSGIEKMSRVAAQNTRVDYREQDNFAILFQTMESYGLFTAHDRTLPAPQEQGQRREEPVTPALDLEHLNTDTKAGRQEAARIMLSENQFEAASWFAQFTAQIQKDFHYQLDQQETEAICNKMRQTNRSWTSAKNWSLSRLDCIKQGSLPQALYYPSERLDLLIEQTDTNSYAGRRALRQAEQQLLGR